MFVANFLLQTRVIIVSWFQEQTDIEILFKVSFCLLVLEQTLSSPYSIFSYSLVIKQHVCFIMFGFNFNLILICVCVCVVCLFLSLSLPF